MFEKFHGAGNDFIFIASDYLSNLTNIIQLKEFVKIFVIEINILGLMVLSLQNVTGEDTSLEIKNINSEFDGSIPETCGNALRCLGVKTVIRSALSGHGRVPVSRFILHGYVHKNDLINEEKFILNNEIFMFLLAANKIILNIKQKLKSLWGLSKLLKKQL